MFFPNLLVWSVVKRRAQIEKKQILGSNTTIPVGSITQIPKYFHSFIGQTGVKWYKIQEHTQNCCVREKKLKLKPLLTSTSQPSSGNNALRENHKRHTSHLKCLQTRTKCPLTTQRLRLNDNNSCHWEGKKEKGGEKKIPPLVGLEPTTFELEVQHASPLRHRGCGARRGDILCY